MKINGFPEIRETQGRPDPSFRCFAAGVFPRDGASDKYFAPLRAHPEPQSRPLTNLPVLTSFLNEILLLYSCALCGKKNSRFREQNTERRNISLQPKNPSSRNHNYRTAATGLPPRFEKTAEDWRGAAECSKGRAPKEQRPSPQRTGKSGPQCPAGGNPAPIISSISRTEQRTERDGDRQQTDQRRKIPLCGGRGFSADLRKATEFEVKTSLPEFFKRGDFRPFASERRIFGSRCERSFLAISSTGIIFQQCNNRTPQSQVFFYNFFEKIIFSFIAAPGGARESPHSRGLHQRG